MRVLVVDADPALLARVHAFLTASGLVVEEAAGPHEGLAAAAGGTFDAVVVGAMPDQPTDGVGVCGLLRRSGIGTPILHLGAPGSSRDCVRALEAGADDCVGADVSPEEMGARVRALARRHLADRAAVLRLGDVELDTASGRATVRGASLTLTGREARLLELLLLRRGAPQPQEAILAGVREGPGAPSTNVVDAYVTRLRRKLAAAGSRVTVVARKRRGYLLEVVSPSDVARPTGAA